MKKKVAILIFLLLTSITFASCTDDTGTQDSENARVEELEKRIDELEGINEEYEERINIHEESLKGIDDQKEMEDEFYREVIERHTNAIIYAIKNLKEKQSEELVKKLWGYELSIDNEKIKESKITTGKKEFWVRLSENYPMLEGNKNINEIINKGEISGNYQDHIKSLSPKPNEETMLDGTVVTAFQYIYKDLEAGDTIKIEITDELKERLGFDSNTVEINVE